MSSYPINPLKYTTKGSRLSYQQRSYIIAAIAVIGLGVLSRISSTGFVIFDKYLGDALYAVLIYLLLRIWRPSGKRQAHANWAMIIVFAIELFQLTGIPLTMRQGDNILLRAASVVLGTHYSWFDIVAYAVGIMSVYVIDLRLKEKTATQKNE